MHKLEGMVDVRNKHCLNPECNKCPSFNYPGKTPGVYCGLHKLPGMIDVKHKRSHLSKSLPCLCPDISLEGCELSGVEEGSSRLGGRVEVRGLGKAGMAQEERGWQKGEVALWVRPD